jgi:hypothetical protein
MGTRSRRDTATLLVFCPDRRGIVAALLHADRTVVFA